MGSKRPPPWNAGKNHSGMSGKHHTEETKKKISDKHKGLPVPEERRIRISKTLTGLKQSEETRLKKSNSHMGHPYRGGGNKKGFKMDLATRHKISESHKGKKLSEETKRKIGIKSRENRLNRSMNALRNTDIELIIQKGLNEKGIQYQKHKTVCNICQPDIIFPEHKTVVFADGDYWHSKEFSNGKTWVRDRNQDKILTENGWIILRFWGSDIISNPSSVINKIIEVIKNN